MLGKMLPIKEEDEIRKIRQTLEHYPWINNIYGQINKYLNWNHFFSKFTLLKLIIGRNLQNKVNDLICTPLIIILQSFLAFDALNHAPLRHYFNVKVYFIYSTKIIIIFHIKIITSGIQRNFFTNEFTCLFYFCFFEDLFLFSLPFLILFILSSHSFFSLWWS